MECDITYMRRFYEQHLDTDKQPNIDNSLSLHSTQTTDSTCTLHENEEVNRSIISDPHSIVNTHDNSDNVYYNDIVKYEALDSVLLQENGMTVDHASNSQVESVYIKAEQNFCLSNDETVKIEQEDELTSLLPSNKRVKMTGISFSEEVKSEEADWNETLDEHIDTSLANVSTNANILQSVALVKQEIPDCDLSEERPNCDFIENRPVEVPSFEDPPLERDIETRSTRKRTYDSDTVTARTRSSRKKQRIAESEAIIDELRTVEVNESDANSDQDSADVNDKPFVEIDIVKDELGKCNELVCEPERAQQVDVTAQQVDPTAQQVDPTAQQVDPTAQQMDPTAQHCDAQLESYDHDKDANKQTEGSKYMCVKCNRPFKNAGGLGQHLKYHKPHPKYIRPRRTCPYCGLSFNMLKRHVVNAHKDQSAVQEIADKPSSFQRAVLANIWNRGILVSPDAELLAKKTGQVHCRKCKGNFSSGYFYRHRKQCHGDQSNAVKPIRSFLLDETDLGFADILQSFHDDEAGDICRTDQTIRLIGKRLWMNDKNKDNRKQEVRKHVMYTMRKLAKLYIQFKEQKKNSTGVLDMFAGCNWEHLCVAVSMVTTVQEPGAKTEIKYGQRNKIYLYYWLETAADVLLDENLTKVGKEDQVVELQNFLKSLKQHKHSIFGESKDLINNVWQETARVPNITPPETPLEELRSYTLRLIKRLTNLHTDNRDAFRKPEFIALRNVICSRITLFNARRGGDPVALTLSQWLERSKWQSQTANEGLDTSEKKLFKELEIVYGTGIGNQLISTLVPSDCKSGVDILCTEKLRKLAGVSRSNAYLFACTDASEGHVGGWDTVSSMCMKAGIVWPQINSANQHGRIRTSNLYASLDVAVEEREYFHSHIANLAQANTEAHHGPGLNDTEVDIHHRLFDSDKACDNPDVQSPVPENQHDLDQSSLSMSADHKACSPQPSAPSMPAAPASDHEDDMDVTIRKDTACSPQPSAPSMPAAPASDHEDDMDVTIRKDTACSPQPSAPSMPAAPASDHEDDMDVTIRKDTETMSVCESGSKSVQDLTVRQVALATQQLDPTAQQINLTAQHVDSTALRVDATAQQVDLTAQQYDAQLETYDCDKDASKQTKGSKHMCVICDRPFKTAAALSTHHKYLHKTSTKYIRPKRTCPYCGISFHQLKRHVVNAHKDQPAIHKIADKPLSFQRAVLATVRNRGILVSPDDDSVAHMTGQVHCRNCKGNFRPGYFYRHKKFCPARDQSDAVKPIRPSLLGETDLDFADILQGFYDDKPGDICRTDPTIRLIGKWMWTNDKNRNNKRQEVRKCVMETMRNLAKLYIQFKKQKKDSTGVVEIFAKCNWAHLCKAVSVVTAVEDPGAKREIKYVLKNKIYYWLKSSAEILHAENLTDVDKEEQVVELEHFLKALKQNKNSIFGDAIDHLNKTRQVAHRLPDRAAPETPLEELRSYTLGLIQSLTNLHTDNIDGFGKPEFVALRNAICSRITLFNARRGGDPTALTVSQWLERSKWQSQAADEGLDTFEKKLFKELEIVYRIGNGNHLISTLVPGDCKSGVDILCTEKLRELAGVLLKNEYLFPNTESSDRHVGGWDAASNMCKKANIVWPQINSTNQRGRISTSILYASLDVAMEERECFHSHIANSARTKIGTYRKPGLKDTEAGIQHQQFDSTYSSQTNSPAAPASDHGEDVDVADDKTIGQDSGRKKWTSGETSLIKKTFKKWLDLPSPSSSLPELYTTKEIHTLPRDLVKPQLNAKCVTESFKHVSNQTRKPKNVQDSRMKVTCTECKKQLSSKVTLKRHMIRFHRGSGSHRCEHCLKVFGMKYHLERHRLNKKGCFPHTCTECSQTFVSNTLLVIHMQIHNNCDTSVCKPAASCSSILFSCSQCSKTFASKSGLDIHLQSHNTYKSSGIENVGDKCGKTSLSIIADSKRRLVRNTSIKFFGKMRKRTGSLWKSYYTFKCFVCGKLLACRTSLEEHTRIHTGEQPHKCTQCGKKFTHKSAHHVHMRVHTDEKPYHCSECSMTFRYSYDFKKHLLVHSGKLFFCEDCRRHFHSKESYQKHLQSHKVIKKMYQCLKCLKSFQTVGHLKRHMLAHASQKMYQCFICEHSFGYSYHLQRHMKSIHKDSFGLTKLSCDLCGKGFSDIEVLKEHKLVIHDRKFTVCCKECGLGFSKHSQLNIHIYRKHGHLFINESTQTHDTLHDDTLPDTHDDTLCPICNKRYSSKGSRNKHYRLYHSKKVT